MAIAFDSSAGGGDGSGGISWNHTCTGSNGILFVAAQGASAASSGISGITYNTVALTKIDGIRNGGSGGRWVELWYLIAPATGLHSVAITATGLSGGCSSSYTGAKQSGIPDASNKGQNTGTSLTVSLTTVADNCWTVCAEGNNQGAPSAGTGLTSRRTDASGLGIFDSNVAITPAGLYSMTTNIGGSSTEGMVCASFAPFTVAPSLVFYKQAVSLGINI